MKVASTRTGGDGGVTPEEALDALRRMLAAAEERRRVAAAQRGLTITDVMVLTALYASDLGPTQLSDLVGVRTSSMTAALDRMAERGLLSRRQGDNRRSIRVSLTDAGREMMAGLREPWLTALDRMSPQARSRLRRAVDELTAVLAG